MRHTVLVLLPILAALAGCASPADRSPTAIEAEMFEPWDALAAQKASLWELGLEPQSFDFEDQGKVTVGNWQLTGWPGNVFVNARVRYENTTDHPVIHAIVWLEVLDADGRVAGSTGVRLQNPLGYPMWPGSSYSLEVRTPTNGAHLDSWSWGIACKALRDDDPGEKPVLLVTRDRLADGLAPGSSWRKLPFSNPRYRGSYYARGFGACPTTTPNVPGGRR